MIPPLPISQTRCTMSYAQANGLPASLEKVGKFLELGERKDASARRTMLQLSRPPKNGKAHSEEKLRILYDYCKQDVMVERALEKHVYPLDESENFVWMQNEAINNRGVKIDRRCAERALQVVKAEKEHIRSQMERLTEGVINTPNKNKALLKWCQEREPRIVNLKKESIQKYLTKYNNDIPEAEDFFLEPDVITALELRQKFAKSSTSKIGRMLQCANTDDRVRGLLAYYGAGTGRWAGRLFQIQNLFKPPYEDEEAERIVARVFELLESEEDPVEVRRKIEEECGDVLTAVASCTRGMLIPRNGSEFYAVDWSNIEGRVLAWLAGEEWLIDAFNECDLNGGDLYKMTYAGAFNILVEEVSKAQRSIGKVMCLSFGYAGVVGAWRKFDSKLPFFSDEEVKNINSAWRFKHKLVVRLWKNLEKAAIKAIQNPGCVTLGSRKEAPVLFTYLKEDGYLIMKLPSGRHIFYPKARVVDGDYGPQIEYDTVKKSGAKKTVRFWCGMITENAVQAIAADILRFALKNLEESGYRVVFHVHDEIVCESLLRNSLKEMEQIMCKLPDWAKGMPIAVAGYQDKRYRK